MLSFKKNICFYLSICCFLLLSISGFVSAQVVTQTFNYTGAVQTFVVPCTDTITIKAWGGGGSGGGPDTYVGAAGGGGGFVQSSFPVVPGQTLTLVVAGGAGEGGGCLSFAPGGIPGWGNGITDGGTGGMAGGHGCSGGGGGGGGGTAMYNGATTLFVAGGGGGGSGGGNHSSGGSGGGAGQDGNQGSSAGDCSFLGFAGASTNGIGTNGGNRGGATIDGAGGGAGGGGYNGGTGGGAPSGCDCGGCGGGGGDSWSSGVNTSIIYASGQTPGNSTDPDLCAGCAVGGYSSAGGNGIIIISYSTSLTPAANFTSNTVCYTTQFTDLSTGGVNGWNWNFGDSTSVNNTSALQNPSHDFTAAGTYTVTLIVTNALGCTATANIMVTVNPSPPVVISASANPICAGTSTTLTVSGANTYSWSGGLGTSTTVTVTPATSTTYIVTSTNSVGCTDITNYLVTVNPDPIIGIAASANPICVGATTTLTASGATDYLWSGAFGNANPINATPPSTTTYTVTGTDVNGCTGTAGLSITAHPNPIVSILSTNNPICMGASSNLTAGGASTYLWSGAFGVANPITISPITATTYDVTGTDINGCTGTTSLTVNVNPNPVVGVTASANPICVGTSTILTPSGGTTYLWSGGLGTANPLNVSPLFNTTYTVTGSDVNGCTGTANITVTVNPDPIVSIAASANPICIGNSTILTAAGAATYVWSGGLGTTNPLTVSPLSTITYLVTGTDINGCTGTSNLVVTVNPLPNPTISPFSPATCGLNNGSATATGGAGYIWSNGQATATITGLAPAVYNVTVTSAAGCSNTNTVTIGNIPGPTVSATSTNENCGQNNGTATATPVGGFGAITYLWNNAQTTATIINLPAGTYDVTVTDANSCTAFASVSLIDIPGPTLNLVGFVNETCTYGNGSATVNAINGLAPYTYAWSNGTSSVKDSNLHAGTYTCTVTDANNCTAVTSVNITNTPGPRLTITSMDSAFCGMPDGAASLNVNGGTAPYLYSWNSSPAQITQDLINVPAGNYTVIVTDNKSCTASVSVVVDQKPGPSASVSSTNEICSKSDGTATAVGSGGMGVYTYLWSNGEITPTDTGLAQGSYTVTVSDGGCTTSATAYVNETLGPVAAFMENPQILTILDGPVDFINSSTGNVVNWQWTFGDNTAGNGADVTHQYKNIGTYLVTLIVTDNNGCKDTITDSIKVKDVFTFYIPNAFTPNGGMLNNTFFPQGMNVDPNNFEMSIFDRWGNLMFHTTEWLTNQSAGWNGTLNNSSAYSEAVTDVYVYRIILKEIDGTKHEYIGKITVAP